MRTTAGRAPRRRDLPPGRRRVPRSRCSSAPTRCSAARACMHAARAGNVTIANAVGNGVADDKLVYTYVPDLIRYYLVRGADPRERRHLAARGAGRARGGARPAATSSCVKPVDGSGGKGLVVGPRATRDELDALRRPAQRRPARLDRAARRAALDDPDAGRATGCGLVTPTCGRSRSTTARTSGCCPAASPASRCPKASWSSTPRSGGGSKDTWVLGDADEAAPATPRPAATSAEDAPARPWRTSPTSDRWRRASKNSSNSNSSSVPQGVRPC